VKIASPRDEKSVLFESRKKVAASTQALVVLSNMDDKVQALIGFLEPEYHPPNRTPILDCPMLCFLDEGD
jgi:hypothetical protein